MLPADFDQESRPAFGHAEKQVRDLELDEAEDAYQRHEEVLEPKIAFIWSPLDCSFAFF